MARVTTEEVREIISSLEEDDVVAAFITSANLLVTQVCTDSSVAGLLKEIERWVAAHFLAIRDPRELRVELGDYSAWYFPASVTTAFSKGLGLTPYGQQAMALDLSGALAGLGKQRASFRAAPRENSGRYIDRLTD